MRPLRRREVREWGAIVMNDQSSAAWKNPAANLLLGALPLEDLRRILPALEPVTLSLEETLCEAYSQMEHVYFPVDCIVSLLGIMADGRSAEVSVVGNEGVVGVSIFMGGDTNPSRAAVQVGGLAYRLSGIALKEEFYYGGAMQQLLLRYTLALLTQTAQTIVCNRHHTVDQQLCRWLLLSIDRLDSNQLNMTQELIANMLGVRRQGVAEVARKLQKAGLINYHRGHIEILDREGLENRACECYQVVKTEYQRLVPDTRAEL